MKDWLGMAWTAMTSKLGGVVSFLLPVVQKLKVAIAGRDIPKIIEACDQIDARFLEMEEAIEAGRELTAHARISVENGDIDAIEAGVGLVKAQKFIDELEDVITGKDEDD